MFDDKFFLVVGGGMLSWLVAWFIKVIWDRNNEVREQIKEVRKELVELKREIEQKYQSKELAFEINKGLKDKLDDILNSLNAVNEKLDKKADK